MPNEINIQERHAAGAYDLVPVGPPMGRQASEFLSLHRRGIAAAAIAAAGFLLAWYLIHHGWYALDKQWDTLEYNKYAGYILDRGLAPYRDFSVEYPPLALPMFVIPRWVAGNHFSGYMETFGVMMAIFGVIAVALSALILVAQRVDTRRLVAAIGLLALSPLLLGAVLLSRYDLFPTALTIGAVAAVYFGWNRSGFVLLALGTAAKAYPAVILPIALVYVWRTVGRRQAFLCLGFFAAVLLVCLVPFLIISPHGVWFAIYGQASRPPQIESFPASVFLAAHQLVGLHLSYYFTHHSDNLNGHPALQFASFMSVVELIALIAVWMLFALGPATRERLLTLAAAAVCAFIVFDRVLSPQYLIWLVPMVAVVPGRRGIASIAMLACAMCMTQIWYPLHFTPLKHFAALESWAVVGRDFILLAMFGTLAWPDVPVWRALRGYASWRRNSGSAPATAGVP